jgi:hypothetical protein
MLLRGTWPCWDASFVVNRSYDCWLQEALVLVFQLLISRSTPGHCTHTFCFVSWPQSCRDLSYDIRRKVHGVCVVSVKVCTTSAHSFRCLRRWRNQCPPYYSFCFLMLRNIFIKFPASITTRAVFVISLLLRSVSHYSKGYYLAILMNICCLLTWLLMFLVPFSVCLYFCVYLLSCSIPQISDHPLLFNVCMYVYIYLYNVMHICMYTLNVM